ncbi:hypothetical protein BDZ89DRAFT_1054541, partial [Hymenopellis radicata]
RRAGRRELALSLDDSNSYLHGHPTTTTTTSWGDFARFTDAHDRGPDYDAFLDVVGHMGRCLRDASFSHLASCWWEGDDNRASPRSTLPERVSSPRPPPYSEGYALHRVSRTALWTASLHDWSAASFLTSSYPDLPPMTGDRPTLFHHDVGRDVGILNPTERTPLASRDDDSRTICTQLGHTGSVVMQRFEGTGPWNGSRPSLLVLQRALNPPDVARVEGGVEMVQAMRLREGGYRCERSRTTRRPAALVSRRDFDCGDMVHSYPCIQAPRRS